jgi:hypothetical protein
LVIWAGRNLTRCSPCGWRLAAGRESWRPAHGRIGHGPVLLLLASAGLNRLRDDFGVAVVTTSWLLTAVVLSGAWFLVTLALPRKTHDPGALLPGALLMGITLTALQAFMQLYLPGRISRASQLMGTIGLAIATLGYMFFVGRIMAASLILNAVIWERVGSISEVVFALPVVRRLPRRFPWIARFFDLATDAAEAEARATANAEAHPRRGRRADPPVVGRGDDPPPAVDRNGTTPAGPTSDADGS